MSTREVYYPMTTTIRLDARLRRWLHARARRERTTQSALIRRWIEEHMVAETAEAMPGGSDAAA